MLFPRLVARWEEETSYGLGTDCGGRAWVYWFWVGQWVCGDVQRCDPGVHYVRPSFTKLGIIFTQDD
jgi:hypothetical protein